MEIAQRDKLKRVVAERLIFGASRDTLRQELLKRLNDGDADAILSEAVRDVRERYSRKDYAVSAKLARRRHFSAQYVAPRVLAWILLVVGVCSALINGFSGQTPFTGLGFLIAGALIHVIVESKVRSKSEAARDAVDKLTQEVT